MVNQNQANVNKTTEQGQEQQQVQQTPAQTTPEVQQVQQVQQTPAQEPAKENWLKKHWKGLTAGVVAVLTAGGSAVVAYKKGKKAGACMAIPQDQEDYSLNPNE